MKAVLAISGGVDSMVMLDIFASRRHYSSGDIIVAHFDHGTRPSASADAEFVCQIADKLGLESVAGRGELGEGVSEELARERRYEFLQGVRNGWGEAEIYTAHHLDDLVETIVINLLRGTGWRGLAVLDAPGVRRPFLEPELLPEDFRDKVPFSKKMLLSYAATHDVVYRQDPTNNEDAYLRNRVRESLHDFAQKDRLYELWGRQKKIRAAIDNLVRELLPAPGEPWERAWFEDLDPAIALEFLRAGTMRAGVSATRPQLERFRRAILTYAPGKFFNLPGDKLVKLGKLTFVL